MKFGPVKLLILTLSGAAILIGLLFLGETDSSKPDKNPGNERLAYFRRLFYSPGDTIIFHSNIDCGSCHQSFRPVREKECKKCHTPDLFLRTLDAVFYDSHLVLTKISRKATCITCHIEHRSERRRTELSMKDIGHEGFAGKMIKCKSCHESDWKQHRYLIKKECQECHSTNDWLNPFTHNKVEGLDEYLMLPAAEKAGVYGKYCGQCHRDGWHVAGNLKGKLSGEVSLDCLICHPRAGEILNIY